MQCFRSFLCFSFSCVSGGYSVFTGAGPCAWRPTSPRERQSTTRGDIYRPLAHLKFGLGRDTKGLATMPGPRAARRRLPVAKKQHLAPFGGCSGSTMKVFCLPRVIWISGFCLISRFWSAGGDFWPLGPPWGGGGMHRYPPPSHHP